MVIQLSRRNLKPDQITMLVGVRYKMEKKTMAEAGAMKSESVGKNCPSSRVSQQIAEQHGISEKTVRNAEKLVDAVETLKQTGVAGTGIHWNGNFLHVLTLPLFALFYQPFRK